MSGNDIQSIPVALRVYASRSRGGKEYMEDNYDLKYQFSSDGQHLQYVFVAVYDGHGGTDSAAKYCKQWLCHNITRQTLFWSDSSDEEVLKAIHNGFIRTHNEMRKEMENWPKTSSGFPSTAGTTASVLFIMNGKYYSGHCGDSRIVLGRKEEGNDKWIACQLTRDHKPETPKEKKRIEEAGGHVMASLRSGTQRVVWERPKPCRTRAAPARVRRRSTIKIPFLSIARSLGDFWSFIPINNTFLVSPEPDVQCIAMDGRDMCLLLATDGLWNSFTPQLAIKILERIVKRNLNPELNTVLTSAADDSAPMSPSRALVNTCFRKFLKNFPNRFDRKDNTTAVVLFIDKYHNSKLLGDKQDLAFNAIDSEAEEDENTDTSIIQIDVNSNNLIHLKKDISKIDGNYEEFNFESKLKSLLNSELSIEHNSSQNSNIDKTDIMAMTPKQEYHNTTNESSMSSPVLTSTPNTSENDGLLTDMEYSALPTLVSLSQDEWELQVIIDSRHLSLNSNIFNTVFNSSEEYYSFKPINSNSDDISTEINKNVKSDKD